MAVSICRLILPVLVLLGLSARDVAAQPEAEARQRAERFADQVVRVQTRTAAGAPGEAGFGILIGEQDGFVYIATPNHVAFGRIPASGLTGAPQVTFRASPNNQVDAERLPVGSEQDIDDLAAIRVRRDRLPSGTRLVSAPMAHGDRLLLGAWAWNIGIDREWEMPERAGGLGRLEPVHRLRRVGQLNTPPGASGGAVVTEDGILGMVLRDGGSYSLVLPIERIVELFQYWTFPTNLLSDAANAVESHSDGKRFRDCQTCPELVVIPAGSFTMGSPGGPDGEEGHQGNEEPQRLVTVRSFAVGIYEVSFDEWDECVKDGGCKGWHPDDKEWGRQGHPVINVSWFDAKEYLAWLTQRSGKIYRLLTESEWEYAARANTVTPFWFGPTIGTDQANYKGKYPYGSGGYGLDRGRTVIRDSFPHNGFGLYNVHGNVSEWVEDCYKDSYVGAPVTAEAVTFPECNFRVVRGGSWAYEASKSRSANRGHALPSMRVHDIGFRVARGL